MNVDCIALSLVAATAFTVPLTVHAQTTLEGSGEHSQIECDGGDASVSGSSNEVTVIGPCRALHVEGSGNVVHADMAPKSSITVVGTSNVVTWRTPGDSLPRISSTGVGNRVSRAR